MSFSEFVQSRVRTCSAPSSPATKSPLSKPSFQREAFTTAKCETTTTHSTALALDRRRKAERQLRPSVQRGRHERAGGEMERASLHSSSSRDSSPGRITEKEAKRHCPLSEDVKLQFAQREIATMKLQLRRNVSAATPFSLSSLSLFASSPLPPPALLPFLSLSVDSLFLSSSSLQPPLSWLDLYIKPVSSFRIKPCTKCSALPLPFRTASPPTQKGETTATILPRLTANATVRA